MATNIYLGLPPPNVVKWIKDNYKEPCPEKTLIIFDDETTWEGLIEGELTAESLVQTGFLRYEYEEYWWEKDIKEVIIGSKVTRIGEKAFMSSTLKTISIPNSVTSIGDMALCNTNLTASVTIPDSVTSIGMSLFANCQNIKTVFFPNTIKYSHSYTFEYCRELNSLPNQTTAQIKEWFENSVFGDGEDPDCIGPAEFTITCKDGTVHAVGRVQGEEEEVDGIGWDITIT